MEKQKAKRKTVSKKLRFEVFKRDSFTCQYCGRMSPDVVLELDHINPVKNGGNNSLMNLVTSCYDCNRGKGARLLEDNNSIKIQQKQLKELNEKREQLKLMLQWKQELDDFDNENVEIIEKIFTKTTNKSFTNVGKKGIKTLIKKYSISEVIESTQISLDNYYDGTEKSFEKCFNYISNICKTRKFDKENPMCKKINYIRGILRNRFNRERDLVTFNELLNVIKTEFEYEEAKSEACNCEYMSDFIAYIKSCKGGV